MPAMVVAVYLEVRLVDLSRTLGWREKDLLTRQGNACEDLWSDYRRESIKPSGIGPTTRYRTPSLNFAGRRIGAWPRQEELPVMHRGHESIHRIRARRTFLTASGVGLLGLGSQTLCQAGQANAESGERTGRAPRAKSTILVWLSGGASHIDMWDMKPDAPVEYRGTFNPIATAAPGIRLCEHLPLLAKQAKHFSLVNSLGHYNRGTGDHHAGYYYNLTGRAPDPSFPALLNARTPYPTDWPFMGSVVAYKRPAHPDLPSLVTLPQKPGAPEYTRPGQFAAKLGQEYDPVYVIGALEKPLDFSVPALTLSGDVSVSRLLSRRHLLSNVDEAAAQLEQFPGIGLFTRQQAKAFTLLGSPDSKAAFDVRREPESVRARYGEDVNGMSMLMARRLVEAGVPFVSVFWQEREELNKLCAQWRRLGHPRQQLRLSQGPSAPRVRS
ncbi:MAG: DUF1501 domain-containing protein [Planctomycetota bacterium]